MQFAKQTIYRELEYTFLSMSNNFVDLAIFLASSGAVGGEVYGSIYEPTHTGSRGGPDSSGNPGPRGGGHIRMRVGSIFHLDGILSADGLSGTSGGAGGGSGGSIWITTGAILHYVLYFSYLLLANSVFV